MTFAEEMSGSEGLCLFALRGKSLFLYCSCFWLCCLLFSPVKVISAPSETFATESDFDMGIARLGPWLQKINLVELSCWLVLKMNVCV